MQTNNDMLFDAVMALPESERLQLLERVDIAVGEEVDEDFLAELERRSGELESGEVIGIPWEEVQSEMEQLLIAPQQKRA